MKWTNYYRRPVGKVLLLLFLLFNPPGASESPTILSPLYIPTAEILVPNSIQLQGEVRGFFAKQKSNLHSDSSLDSNASYQIPYAGMVQIGIGERTQAGVGWGERLFLSIRTRILDEDGWIPNAALGARGLIGSPEAILYTVSDPDTAGLLQGEIYLVSSKTFFNRTRLHAGAGILSGIEKGFPMPFGGLEQYLGLGFSLNWEIFNRFGGYHQNLGFDWRFKDLFRFSLGMTELQSWIVQQGKWGLFTKPLVERSDGYNSPGLYFSVRICGWTGTKEQTLNERVQKMETRLLKVQKDLSQSMGNLQRLSETVERMDSRDSEKLKAKQLQVLDYLELIHRRISLNEAYDPNEVKILREKILSQGRASTGALTRILSDPGNEPGIRAQACILMGMSGDNSFFRPLSEATGDLEPMVRKEAALALGNLQNKAALPFLRKMIEDPDLSVELAARKALQLLGVPSPDGKQPFEQNIPTDLP